MDTSLVSPCILIGEEELEVRQCLEMTLKCFGCRVEVAASANEVIKFLQARDSEISLVLLDLLMPDGDGLETLRSIRLMNPDIPVIVMAGACMPNTAALAIECGAVDFVAKPMVHGQLKKAIDRVLNLDSRRHLTCVAKPASQNKSFRGQTAGIREIYSLIKDIGWSEAPVLIQGETGTGKEVLARELHAHSPRAGLPFLKLNCAALPSELVESELFGYERGAFTGAFQKKLGMFERADGGTILLDEIGDMEYSLQAKLLQVLQDQQFHRIGGKEIVSVSVRIIAATHQDLLKAIEERRFRNDLYYRLNVINLVLPALRERKEDIVPLSEFLLELHSRGRIDDSLLLTRDLKRAFCDYTWPGNVRELENVIRKLIVLRDPHRIVCDLHARPQHKPAVSPSASPILEQAVLAKKNLEIEAIVSALNATRWNRKKAAELLNIDYKGLLYKMKKLGVGENIHGIEPKVESDSHVRQFRCGS